MLKVTQPQEDTILSFHDGSDGLTTCSDVVSLAYICPLQGHLILEGTLLVLSVVDLSSIQVAL